LPAAAPAAERTPLIAGFAIEGQRSKSLLIRAVGPTLAAFGVSDVLREPLIVLYREGTAHAIASGARWEATADAAEIAKAAVQVGAFALPVASADAALLATLAPGSYTVHVSGAGNSSGSVLLELYEIPR
jgi:hypothetical protein